MVLIYCLTAPAITTVSGSYSRMAITKIAVKRMGWDTSGYLQARKATWGVGNTALKNGTGHRAEVLVLEKTSHIALYVTGKLL